MLFKVGDVVRVKPNQPKKIPCDVDLVVRRVDVHPILNLSLLYIEGLDEGFYHYRFILKEAPVAIVPPAPVKALLVKDLRIQASALKIKNYSRMNKVALMAQLAVKQAAPLALKPAEKPAAPKAPTLGEELQKKVEATHVGTCSYAYISGTGERRFLVHDVCHARMTAMSMKQAVCNVAGHYKELKELASYKAWIEFHLQEGPYRAAYLTKTWEDAMREGVYLDVEKQSISRCVTAAIALREGSEYSDTMLPVFDALIKKGFSRKASAFIARHIRLNNGVFKIQPNNGGHATIAASMQLDEVLKFWKEGFWKPDDKPASVNAQRYSVFATIAKYSNYAAAGSLQPFLLETFKTNLAEGWAAVAQPITERSLFAGMEQVEALLK